MSVLSLEGDGQWGGENYKNTRRRLRKGCNGCGWSYFMRLRKGLRMRSSGGLMSEYLWDLCCSCVCLLLQEVSYDSCTIWICLTAVLVYYCYSESLSPKVEMRRVKCPGTTHESGQLLGRFRKIPQLYLCKKIEVFHFKVTFNIKEWSVWTHPWIPIECG